MVDLKSETMTREELEEWAATFQKSHRFTWAYREEHREAAVRVATIRGTVHCYVYDPARDIVVDANLDRFDGLQAGCWDGAKHPQVDDATDEAEFREYGRFLQSYAGPESPFEF